MAMVEIKLEAMEIRMMLKVESKLPGPLRWFESHVTVGGDAPGMMVNSLNSQ